MKTSLIILAILAVGALGAWYYYGRDALNQVADIIESPTPLGALFAEESPPQNSEGVIFEEAEEIFTPTPTSQPAPIVFVPFVPRPSPTPVVRPVFISMNAFSGSSETGVTTLSSDSRGNAVVSFNLSNWPEGVSQPAVIYRGTCASVGNPGFTLNPLFNGSSITALNMSLGDLLNLRPLAVMVGKSMDDPQFTFSCGEVQ